MSRSAQRGKQVGIALGLSTALPGCSGFKKQTDRLGQFVNIDVARAELPNDFLLNQMIGTPGNVSAESAVSHGSCPG
jgi:hypothetical protein